jgi:Txe/YoeB family toxin of Txe-Axe toxin-antitoxin module
MDQYSEILVSFGTKDTLNPEIWNDYESDNPVLKSNIRKALLNIAGEFMDFLGEDLFIDDVRFTGSLANFNWSKFSDIDLHILVDFSQFDPEDREVYKELYNLKKTLFNTTHKITVKGYEVELYAEDINEVHHSTGVYSVLFDQWVAKPEKEDVKIDREQLSQKSKNVMAKIDALIEDVSDDELDTALEKIEKFKEKIKKYRSAGLEKDGEYSYENLVFKFLRRSGYIDRLFKFKNSLMDKKLSLENQEIE